MLGAFDRAGGSVDVPGTALATSTTVSSMSIFLILCGPLIFRLGHVATDGPPVFDHGAWWSGERWFEGK